MIWKDTYGSHHPARAALVNHVIKEMATAERPASPEETNRRAAAAEAVAAFLQCNGHGDTVASEYLLMLMARALCAIGDKNTARRLVHAGGRPMNFPPRFAELAANQRVSLPEWREFFASRAVRPTAFSSFLRHTLWILDIPRLLPADAACIEITAMRTISSAIARLADVWDETRGRGYLGLRGLLTAAASILAAPPETRPCRALALDMKRHAYECLKENAARRGWDGSPTLVRLDFR